MASCGGGGGGGNDDCLELVQMRIRHAAVARRMKSPNDKAAVLSLATAEVVAHRAQCPECREAEPA